MFKPTYLYIKTHNITGLKYFGKTTAKDPFKYRGSGTVWLRHLKKHGRDISTEILGHYTNKEECLNAALEFSKENNIVESAEWANLKEESLDGGWDHVNSLDKNIRRKWLHSWYDSLTEEERRAMNSKKARPKDKNGMFGSDRSGSKNPRYGIHDDFETYKKISESNKGYVVVKEISTGKIFRVSVKDEDYISKKLVPINLGKKATKQTKEKMSKIRKEIGIIPPSPKGLLWWTNGIICVRSKDRPGIEFRRGRK